MTRSRLLGIFGFLLSLSFPCFAAEPFLKIDESKIRLDIDAGALLHLPVTNASAQPISTRLTLDFLDSWNEVVYSLGREVTVQRGATLVEFSIPQFLELDDAKRSHYGWLRMRYSFSDDASGIVSVSRIAPEPFVLKVLKQRKAAGDFPFQVQIVAQDSAAGRGKGGVAVKGTLTFGGDSKPVVLRTTAHTNSQGGATLEFNIPRMPPESEAELEVTAQLGSFVRTVTDSFDLSDEIQVITTTDKPIYQPGQKLRLRFLAFDHARRALEKVPFDVTISDSGQSNVFETQVLTSRFGEAHVEWAIPASARLGDYAIEIARPDSYRNSHHRVRVDRYELPNFSVDVKPDRPYYLPRQNAQIEVRADYLFGQPVKKGKVKVVREQERHWDYRSLKWVVEEGRTVEGLTGEDGRFLVNVDLEDEHDSLEQRQRDKIRDIEYAAYVTDPTTNRTEQRRFSVRIAASPIQIYVLGNFDQRAGYPMEFYLSASYADGKPALCNIEILESQEEGGRRLGVAKTNKYGVARVTGLVSPPQWADERNHARFKFKARDSEGLTGDDDVYFYVKDEVVRVRTDKALYRATDSLSVHIESSRSIGTVLLNVLRDEKPIYRKSLRLANGRASTVIPNFAALKGNILVSAYVPGDSGQSDGYGIRAVAFPDDGELQLDARPNKSQYKPGEEAAIRLSVRNASGQPEDSLLGISIIDKAVDERARTDSSFGAYRSFCPYCWSFWGITAEVGGLTRRDLDRVDRSKPVPLDLELLAEVLLAAQDVDMGFPEEIDDSPSIPRASDEIWRHNIEDRFAAINAPPADEEALRAVIAAADPGIASMRDPWGNPLKFSRDVISDRYVVRLVSAGPDEMFHSADDFQMGQLTWRYFADYGKRVQLALATYHTRTDGYIRDYSTLRSELLRAGDDFEAWRDPWGRPYRAQFGISTTRYTVTIQSEGPDANRTAILTNLEGGDGSVEVWVAGTDYTPELRASLDTSLNRFYRDQQAFPETETQFQAAMQAAGISQTQLTDPWGHAYYPIFKTRYAYVDRITIQAGAIEARNITPVTEQVRIVSVRSAGPDGMEGTSDDFEIATFVQPTKEQAVEDPNPRISESLIFNGLSGAVRAVVVDSSGALIPGVSARITTSDGRTLEALTDAEGGFMLRNLPPGVYRVEFSLPGFQSKVISALRVNSGTVTNVVATLEVGSVSTLVEVNAVAEVLLASAASVGEVRREIFPGQRNAPISTPRLRQYFPETLLWQPSLETGAEGTALIRFKLADSITTWKVSAIASTADGRIGLVEKEILSTQPFFLDHDPPKVLTRGDEIALPVVVRSYLEKAQSLELSMKPESWFTPLDSLMRTFHIESGEARREIFTFKAATDARDVKQRVTGLGTKASDAIEKSLSVFPHGQEIHQTSSGILRGTSAQEVVVPPDAIPGSVRAELKIYPNLMAHVVDAIEGIMKRPYGCAEQTISSAYPSLLFLRYTRQTGQKPNAVSERATRYLEIGYGRLLNYQTADGGFAYWTHDKADIAVTAYAIRFLHQAGDFLKVDKDAIDKAYDWLLMHQSSNGSWDSDTTLTALVAEVLSAPSIRRKDKDPIPHALAFLSAAMGSSEPYSVAMSALAALNADDNELAERALDRLERMTHREGDSAYWDLQTNTPFYGWGLPGRLETTAIVVRAFAAGRSVTSPLVDQGLSFLLKNKDHFGVWYSTQATVKTLEALAMLIGSRTTDAEGAAQIRVNGAPVASITFGNKQRPTSPVTLDLSQFLSPGANRIEVRQTKGGSAATIQVIESHYVPWAASPQEQRGALRLAVRFDKMEAAVSDEITAYVSAERVGFKGYGMLLAEIGLPPGADVDRASLEGAMANAGGIQSYDVLPDRIVAYLWPRAGGVQFEFKFRPRYGIRALTAASAIYDYYNPEERAVVSPVRFLVH